MFLLPRYLIILVEIALGFHFSEKIQQLPVDLIGMSPVQAMWSAFDNDESGSFDKFMCTLSTRVDWDNSIGITMNDQCWYVYLYEILAKVG
jgi:hypothetical protein